MFRVQEVRGFVSLEEARGVLGGVVASNFQLHLSKSVSLQSGRERERVLLSSTGLSLSAKEEEEEEEDHRRRRSVSS